MQWPPNNGWSVKLRSSQKTQHGFVELFGFFHWRVMTRPGDDNLACAGNFCRERIGNILEGLCILPSYNNECGHTNASQPFDSWRLRVLQKARAQGLQCLKIVENHLLQTHV